eukprot:2864400-Amphidinium_carterae.1
MTCGGLACVDECRLCHIAPSALQKGGRLVRRSVIEELEIEDGMMHYRLISGEGPPDGWVQVPRN